VFDRRNGGGDLRPLSPLIEGMMGRRFQKRGTWFVEPENLACSRMNRRASTNQLRIAGGSVAEIGQSPFRHPFIEALSEDICFDMLDVHPALFIAVEIGLIYQSSLKVCYDAADVPVSS
jgi:hypothetical protein